MNKLRYWVVFALMVAVAFSATPTLAGEQEAGFNELGEMYYARDEKDSCRAELIASVPESDPLALWESIWDETDPALQGGLALAFVEKTCPEGDLSRWTEVKGYFVPGQYDDNGVMIVAPSMPRQVAVLQAALAAMAALPETGDLRALWVARDMFFDLKAQSEFSKIGDTSAKEDYAAINDNFSFIRKMYLLNGKPFPWGDRSAGALPLNLKKLRYYKDPISFTKAQYEKMFMLNHDGQICAETGEFAWDWKNTGHTYLLIGGEEIVEGDGQPNRPSRQQPGQSLTHKN